MANISPGDVVGAQDKGQLRLVAIRIYIQAF